MPKNKIIFIVGPTAVGKTRVACCLAETWRTEIVSCDAMQVYQEISILSGKASEDILKKVRHHMVNIVSVEQPFDVFIFFKEAQKVIQEIIARGKIPLVVGGSGLYMSILLDGIFEEEAARDSFAIRQKIQDQIRDMGVDWAFEKVQRTDPVMANKIHKEDTRRIARILEVYEVYGKPISDLHAKRQGLWGQYDIRLFALRRDRSSLYQMIDDRTNEMFAQGAIEEVKKIDRKKLSRTAEGIIGIKEIRRFLQGALTREQALALIQQHTRHFAKRQMTWFRRDKRLEWIDIADGDSALDVAKKILSQLEKT